MDVQLLDSTYTVVRIIDEYISLNWSDRSRKVGEFELIVPASEEILAAVKTDMYLSIPESDKLMIVEDVELSTDVTEGDTVKITGRSLESILDRRIIFPQLKTGTDVREALEKIVRSNLVSPSDSKRRIPNFTIRRTSKWQEVSMEETEYYKDNVLDTVEDLCERYNVEYRVLPDGDGGFVFEVYQGEDRSWDQEENAYVVFSNRFDNLISTNYILTNHSEKNACYVTYEVNRTITDGDKGSVQVTSKNYVLAEKDGAEGLKRREMTVDSEAESPNMAEASPTDISNYIAAMREQGRNAMAESKEIEAMDGELDYYTQFIYGRDYTIGDIVQVENAYGISAKCRVSEMVISVDSSGHTRVPTFEFIKEET